MTKSAVREALQTQQRSGEPIGKVLVDQGALTAKTLLLELAHQHGVATVTAEDRGIALLPANVALQHSAVALAVGPRPVSAGALTAVGLVDLVHAPAISSVLGRAIEPRLTDAATFARLFHEAYGMQPPKIEPPEPAPEPAPEPEAQVEPEAAVGSMIAAQTNGNGNRNHAAPAGGAEIAAGGAEPDPGLPVGVAAATAEPATAQADTATPAGPSSPPSRSRWRRRSHGQPVPATPEPQREDRGEPATATATESTVPTTTVLVVLHRATPVTVGPLADALERLDYPRHRMQAMAVYDPSDAVTGRTLRAVELPAWVVPLPPSPADVSGPRGLLLRGLREASGDLLTVVQSARQLSHRRAPRGRAGRGHRSPAVRRPARRADRR